MSKDIKRSLTTIPNSKGDTEPSPVPPGGKQQVCGGNFFADLEDVLRKIFTEPSKPANPGFPQMPEPMTSRG